MKYFFASLRFFSLSIVPKKLKITLKNDVKNAQSSKEGVYILESELVNRKPSWSQLSGTNKIWWLDGAKQWCIATKASGFMSDTDVFLLPQEVTKWKYYRDMQWVGTTDLVIGNYVFSYFCGAGELTHNTDQQYCY